MDQVFGHKRKRNTLSGKLWTLLGTNRKTPRSEIGLTHFTLFTALSLVSLTDTTFSLAVDWLTRRNRRGPPLTPGISRETVRTLLEDIVIDSTPEEICSWQDMETAPCPTALRAAYKILAKHRMAMRVQEANSNHGVAPSSKSLLRKYNGINRSLREKGVHLSRVGLERRPGISTPRSFMAKFRREKRVKFGRLRFGEPLTLEQKREKVMEAFCRPPLTVRDPIFGPPKMHGKGLFSVPVSGVTPII